MYAQVDQIWYIQAIKFHLNHLCMLSNILVNKCITCLFFLKTTIIHKRFIRYLKLTVHLYKLNIISKKCTTYLVYHQNFS